MCRPLLGIYMKEDEAQESKGQPGHRNQVLTHDGTRACPEQEGSFLEFYSLLMLQLQEPIPFTEQNQAFQSLLCCKLSTQVLEWVPTDLVQSLALANWKCSLVVWRGC